MKFFSFASSSSGNAYAVYENPNDIVIIDAGIPLHLIKSGLAAHGLTLNNVHYVLISHVHSDHIKGLQALLNNTEAFIVCNEVNARRLSTYKADIITFNNDDSFYIADFLVKPIQAHHDIPTNAFILEHNDSRLSLITDTGHLSINMMEQMKDMDFIAIESNYSEQHLRLSGYPKILQTRIASKRGHLSNIQAYDALTQVHTKRLKQVLFVHLSKNSNSPQIVQSQSISQLEIEFPDTIFSIAPYDSCSDLFHI